MSYNNQNYVVPKQAYNLINSLGFLVTLDIRKTSFTSVKI